jgi:hemoglobin-like flavoprotein
MFVGVSRLSATVKTIEKDPALVGSDELNAIRASWALVADKPDLVARLFYGRLFTTHPNLRPLFKTDVQSQGRKLIGTLNMLVRSLGNPQQTTAMLSDLGVRNLNYGVKPKDYDAVGASLLWTWEQGLGEAYTPEVKAAWTSAFSLIANAMIGATAEMNADP